MEFEPWKPGNQANRWLSRYGAGWPSGWAGWRYSPSSMGYSAIRPSRIIASPGDQLKSHILLAISARVARKFNYSQEDIALVEDLLDRGCRPQLQGACSKVRRQGRIQPLADCKPLLWVSSRNSTGELAFLSRSWAFRECAKLWMAS